MKREFYLLIFSAIIMVLAIHAITIYTGRGKKAKHQSEEHDPYLTDEFGKPKITLNKYGIEDGIYEIAEGNVRRNQTLSGILSEFGVNNLTIHRISQISSDIFNVRRIRAGDNYKLFICTDSLPTPKYFIYEPNLTEFIKVTLYDSIFAERHSREVTQVLKEVSGTINSSLWNSLAASDASPVIAIFLSQIYAWNIDFFGLFRGDSYKVFYYENYVDDTPVGVSRVKAALFNHRGRNFYAIPFEQDSILSFFDENGNSLRRAFLKAPLDFSRISSGFSNARMHPILRVVRPHHGVDYAAPSGTPVYAIGDGRIIEASYSAGPGNMVRIQHNSVYTSGYMHLRNFAGGIRQGVWVNQGDVIGYVGSTGLSTGPHLDFRVWQNGHPVNPLTIESPPVDPVKEENMTLFSEIRDYWLDQLSE